MGHQLRNFLRSRTSYHELDLLWFMGQVEDELEDNFHRY